MPCAAADDSGSPRRLGRVVRSRCSREVVVVAGNVQSSAVPHWTMATLMHQAVRAAVASSPPRPPGPPRTSSGSPPSASAPYKNLRVDSALLARASTARSGPADEWRTGAVTDAELAAVAETYAMFDPVAVAPGIDVRWSSAGEEGIVALVEPGQPWGQAVDPRATRVKCSTGMAEARFGLWVVRMTWTGCVPAVVAVSARPRRTSVMRVCSCGWRWASGSSISSRGAKALLPSRSSSAATQRAVSALMRQ